MSPFSVRRCSWRVVTANFFVAFIFASRSHCVTAVDPSDISSATYELRLIPKYQSTAPAYDNNLTIFRPKESPHRNVYLLKTTDPNIGVLLPSQKRQEKTMLARMPSPHDVLQSLPQVRRRRTENNRRAATVKSPSPPHQQYTLAPTSSQAKLHDCCFAVNGGPFNPDGSSVGTVIVDHQVVMTTGPLVSSSSNHSSSSAIRSSSFSPSDVGFGRTPDAWIFGALASQQQANDLQVIDFVTGMGWLVYDSQNVVVYNVQRRAPRTAVGVDVDGKLVIVVADGAEHWYALMAASHACAVRGDFSSFCLLLNNTAL
jgi:hypothetical protein